MKKITCVCAALLLTGCGLDYESVQLRTKACKDVGGEVELRMLNSGKADSVRCAVDGIKYRVNYDGKLK